MGQAIAVEEYAGYSITSDDLMKGLFASDETWMLRMDNDGVSYAGFRWKPLGVWTVAPDWNAQPMCGYGLHGQGQSGHGYTIKGSRIALCAVKVAEIVVVDGDKIKVPRARIVAVDDDALRFFGAEFVGSLYLECYAHPLPEGLTHVGDSLDLPAPVVG